MKTYQEVLRVPTRGRGFYEITSELSAVVRASGVATGLVHAFIRHTSASLIINENADPSVRRDLDAFMLKVAPDGDPAYEHDTEGDDDMPAHIRTALTQTGVTVPVTQGRPALGTWQGLYVWEHRYAGSGREVVITVQGA